MDPIELIQRDLGKQEIERARESWREPIVSPYRSCPFVTIDTFIVRGQTGQFDFPSLPTGSYGFYAANDVDAVRLTRGGKEIERILAGEWPLLPNADSAALASFILMFYDGGIKATHSVLADAESLRTFAGSRKGFEIDEQEFNRCLTSIGTTCSLMEGDQFLIRAVTLCGWMHDKRNLGIERLRVARDGEVILDERLVLSRGIFKGIPHIRY
jgi:hypothetical protein